MINKRNYIVYDFETDGPDPETANIVEIAAVPVRPDDLKILEDYAFVCKVRPPGIENEEYFDEKRNETINWHANTRGVTREEIIKQWQSGKDEKLAIKEFCSYIRKYKCEKTRGNWYTEPIPSGYNIRGFDNVILQRKLKDYRLKWPFSKTTIVDMMDIVYVYFENLDEPENLKMDTLRKFFGMKAHGQAHEAFSDVIDEAKIFTKFMRFIRRQSSVGKFKGSFAND